MGHNFWAINRANCYLYIIGVISCSFLLYSKIPLLRRFSTFNNFVPLHRIHLVQKLEIQAGTNTYNTKGTIYLALFHLPPLYPVLLLFVLL